MIRIDALLVSVVGALALTAQAVGRAAPTVVRESATDSTLGALVAIEEAPAGLGAEDWSTIREAYEASRHAAVAVVGGHQARNPGQRWHTRFDGRGSSVQPDAGGWEWGLELLRYGFAGAERALNEPRRVSVAGQRVVYEWDEVLEEWYVNDTRGLEHGFTVRERPPPGAGERSLLCFTLAVRGALRAQVAGDGRDVRFVGTDGAALLTYTGLVVLDADGKELVAGFETTTAGLRLCIDERGARYPLTIDPLAQQAYLKASNTEAGDSFGHSVAVSGNTVVVGAFDEASTATGVNGNGSLGGASGSGAAYVFVRNGTTWSQQAYLKASNTGAGDSFGVSVAVSVDTVVVGATGEESDATGVNGDQSDNSAPDSGAAYVFVRSGTTWSQEAYLKASNTGQADLFGGSVAVLGDTLVVGAQGEDSNATGVNGIQSDNSAPSSGAAYVFVRNGTTWSQAAYLKPSNTDPEDMFGISVSASVAGNTVVVGALHESSDSTTVNGDESNNDAPKAGAAYVFVRNGTTWSQQAYLKASNSGADDRFGFRVSASSNTVLVGAYAEDSDATGVNGDGSSNSASASGAAYVFVRSGTTWSQEAFLKPSNTGEHDRFGISVSMALDTAVVGASQESSNASGVNGDQSNDDAQSSGAAYVFVRSGATWSQQAYLKASNTGGGDRFGTSVAVSGDTVVVGAPGEASGASGVNGDQGDDSAQNSGAAYAFDPDLLATVASRNAGSNPASYVANPIVIGATFGATVDNNLAAQLTSVLFAFDSPFSLTLGGGQTLLCLDLGSGELFTGGALAPASSLAGVDSYAVSVPNDPALCGLALCSQAIQFGAPPFALSNAQDLTIGNL